MTSAAGSSRRRAGRQVGWTVVDQVLSSVSNFGLVIMAARGLDPDRAGAFVFAFLVFTFAIGLSRTFCNEPLTIRYSAATASERRQATLQAAGSSLAVGTLAGLACLTAGIAVGGSLGLALGMLLVVLPGQFLQDCWRTAAFASRDPREAALNDAVRAVVTFAGLAACAWSGTSDLLWYSASWAVGAWVPALLGVAQFGLPAGPARCWSWFRDHVGLSLRLGTSVAVNMGSITLAMSVFAALLGLAATGGLRFAQTILGPLQVLFSAIEAFVVPFYVRRAARSGAAALWQPALVLAAGSMALSGVVVGALLLLPDSIGSELLGESWAGAREVMLPVGVHQCAVALALAGAYPLLALGRADLLLRLTLLQAPMFLAFGVAGALRYGISGAAWGMAIPQAVGAVLTILALRRATRREPLEAMAS